MIRNLLLLSLAICSLKVSGQTFEVENIGFSFEVQKWEKVNSKFSDFGAVLYNDQIIFCTERNIDQVLVGENNWKKGKHYNIFSYHIVGKDIVEAELKKPSLFSEKFTFNSHTGPICFSETKDTVFFSRVEKVKLKGKEGKFNFKPQMYMCIRVKNGWGKLKKLAFNENGYSFSHPSFDSKKQELYFASDRPGGLGESDIYKAKLDSGGNFTMVENLGENVNSDSKEMFPFFYKGDLFYSSDRKTGKGGLDIYWTYVIGQCWKKSERLGDDINTSEDDFSMYIYADYSRGFIASNQNGNDDIFYFDMEKKVTIQSALVGEFSYRNLDNDVSNIKVQLTSDNIDMVFETVSNEVGKFNLRELPSGEKYTVNVVNNSDDDLYVTFYNEDGKVISKMIINGRGNFEYKELNSESSLIALIENEDDFTIGTTFTGKIVTSDHSIPDKTLKIVLVDVDGQSMQSTETDKNGNFLFKEIDYDANNRIKLENYDDDYSLFVFNDKGEIIAKLRIDENGVFTYRQLKNETSDLSLIDTEDDEFSFATKYFLGELIYNKHQKIRMDSIYVEVYNKDRELLERKKINSSDNFMFDELPLEDIYLFKTNYDEDPLALNLYDHNGKLIAKLVRDPETGFFLYKLLENDRTIINLANTDDHVDFNFNHNNSTANNYQENNNNGNVNVSNFTGYEKNIVYFDVNSSFMTDKEKSKLNTLINELKAVQGPIMIEGHTDINGANDYNQWLSQRRSQRVLNFLVSKGVPRSKIQITYYGEEKPKKVCPEGGCTEDQVHKFNRRVSLKY